MAKVIRTARRRRQYENLLENCAPERRNREVKNILERVARGDMHIKLGVLRETIGSDVFGALTADLMHKRAMKGFEFVAGEADWRKLVSDFSSPSDFRLNNAVRTTEVATLDDVPASGKYKEKYFTDEKTSYRIAKRGNIVSASMEAMANDELAQIGKSVQKLSRAAKRVVLNFVFNTLVNANPTMAYDSVALFHASHANNLGASTPLNLANLEAAWKKLRTQTGTASEVLNLAPKYLIVHPDEEVQAYQLINSMGRITANQEAVATTFVPSDNFFKGKLEIIVTQYVTSGVWYVAADPQEVDSLEVGFYLGRQEPELFAEPAGSAAEFETDTMRWKVRIIFGGVTLDHRWIVRGNVA